MTERNAQAPEGETPPPPDIPPLETLLAQISEALRARLRDTRIHDPLLVGVHTGGYWIAEHLARTLGLAEPISGLDVSLYRDDYDSRGLKPEIRATSLPDSTAGRHIILVDDVILTGRTVRGAMNLLFDYGRPASVTLVQLLDLPGRQLPIQPDICGHRLDTLPPARIKLVGPDPLRLVCAEALREDGP